MAYSPSPMIAFVHLLNDRSGSPRVLKSVITSANQPCALFIGSDGDGLLSEVPCPRRTYWYRRTNSRLLTLVTFMLSQLALFIALARARLPKDALIYVNTLLPFGAAIFGKLTGRRVVYHVHEVSLSPRIFQRFLVGIARWTSTRLIYVSEAHRKLLPIAPILKDIVVPNGIDPDLAEAARDNAYHHRHDGMFVVLMLATPAPYKGVAEFMALANRLSYRNDIEFRFAPGRGGYDCPVPTNVTILPPANDPAPYYASANLVLNLSRPDLWVETFGLTLLEAMAFGVPVIAPPVGGPAELVRDSEGYLIDCRDTDALASAVERLADDAALHQRMSAAARARAAQFSPRAFEAQMLLAIAEAKFANPRSPDRIVIGDYEVTY